MPTSPPGGSTSLRWDRARPTPDTERQIAEFAQLLASAIANADAHDEATASRARLLSAADAARRRVVRDLHDGAQQRLVETVMTLKLAQRAIANGAGSALSIMFEAELDQTTGRIQTVVQRASQLAICAD